MLNHHFPRKDWEDLFWGFTDCFRQVYAGLTPLNAEDEILLGIYSRQGGCLPRQSSPQSRNWSGLWQCRCDETQGDGNAYR